MGLRILLCSMICSMSFPLSSLAAKIPRAAIVPFTETIHGETIADPYRWMEHEDDKYRAWLNDEAVHARARIAELPKLAALRKAISEKSSSTAVLLDARSHAGLLFSSVRQAGAQHATLRVRDRTGAERSLFDPASLDGAGTGRHAIDYWEVSPNGRHVYVGVSTDGSELSTLRIIDVANGKLLPEAIPLAMFNYDAGTLVGGPYPQWLPDSSAFFYRRRAAGVAPGSQDFFLHGRVLLHKLQTDPTKDVLIAQGGQRSRIDLPPNAIMVASTTPGSRFVVLLVAVGVERSIAVHVASLASAKAGTPDWHTVATAADQVESVALTANDLYLLRRDRTRGRVVKTSAAAPSLATAIEVVAESDVVLQRVLAAKDGIYVIDRGADGNHVRHLGFDDVLTPIRLPFNGAFSFESATPDSDGIYFGLENYTTPPACYLAVGSKIVDTGLAPRLVDHAQSYVADSVLVRARDGTKVPLDIVRRRDAPKDGARPVLMEAYGAYGSNLDASYSPRLFPLLDQGAIYAVAHVRGGGELGEDWRKGGFQATKPNTWRDAIDSAQWLIDAGWSDRGKVTIWGASAGGIMAGRAVTERPDLWAGGIASVGVMNPLRLEFTPSGKANVVEYGTIKTPEGFRSLKLMDAYHAIRDGIYYPPVLLTAGLNDQRVVSWQPAKFVARMRAATRGGPVIFRVNTDDGHGNGSSRSQLDEEFATASAFALWAAEASKTTKQ